MSMQILKFKKAIQLLCISDALIIDKTETQIIEGRYLLGSWTIRSDCRLAIRAIGQQCLRQFLHGFGQMNIPNYCYFLYIHGIVYLYCITKG